MLQGIAKLHILTPSILSSRGNENIDISDKQQLLRETLVHTLRQRCMLPGSLHVRELDQYRMDGRDETLDGTRGIEALPVEIP